MTEKSRSDGRDFFFALEAAPTDFFRFIFSRLAKRRADFETFSGPDIDKGYRCIYLINMSRIQALS